jgi:serine protease inhibitor
MQKLTIELNVPKMDVASHMDIREALSKMGVTDCFDKDKADFSSVTDSSYNGKGLYITDAEHGVRVSINEEGCTGTAFTSVSDNDPPASEEAERTFTIDKPFIFVITGADGLPLFIGTVYQPITQ